MIESILESQSWRCVEAVAPIGFAFEATTAIRACAKRRETTIATAEGRVEAVDDDRIWLTDGDDVTVELTLPSCVDLRPIVGERLRITLRDDPSSTGPTGQLLTLSDESGRTRLLAFYGRVQGNQHVVGEVNVRVALSQRSGGPLVVGTSQQQCMLGAGEEIAVRDALGDYVIHFVSRTSSGYAAYVLVEKAMWRATAKAA
jgi:hypothetical protein